MKTCWELAGSQASGHNENVELGRSQGISRSTDTGEYANIAWDPRISAS